MSWKQVIVVLAALAPAASQAAVIRTSQDVFAGGDFAFGVYDDNYMPTFDTSLGTLTAVRVHLDGLLQWGQPFVAETESPGPGTYETESAVFIYGNGGSWEFDGPTQFHNFTSYVEGASQNVEFQEAFSDDPTVYLDPTNPEDLVINLGAAAFCVSNCIDELTDDVLGYFSGTLRTTFIYSPAFPVPEPSSMLVFLTGAGLLGFAAHRRTGVSVSSPEFASRN